jgi:V/A-type H+-transporting ATPase subunit D
MAGEKLDGINPTRMELLNLKDRAKLSTKGHSLLKEKRDALIKEFFEILDRVQGSRDEVEKKLAIAYAELNKAQIDMGDMAVKRAALSVRESIELDISSRSIMGVSVPVVKSHATHNDLISRGYGLAGTSANLDIAAKEFEESIKIIIELGEIETAAMGCDGVTRACCLYDAKKKKIVLFYTGDRDKKELLEEMKESLPVFMIPNKAFELDEMPLNKNGKIDRNALKETGGIQ